MDRNNWCVSLSVCVCVCGVRAGEQGPWTEMDGVCQCARVYVYVCQYVLVSK